MKTDLLWVYEGLTEYLADVLTARSGFWTAEEYREMLALSAARLDRVAGRTWRPLRDTAVAAPALYNAGRGWASWRRGVDFYAEGELIWLEADTIVREKSGGKRTLDDFCRRFFGGEAGPPEVRPYAERDLLAALEETASFDWRSFFDARLDSTEPRAPLGGIERSGWKLATSEEPNRFQTARESKDGSADFGASLGFTLDKEGLVADVVPGSAAGEAGLGAGMKLIAVGGRRFSIDLLQDAIDAAKDSGEPIELLVENGEFLETRRVDYHEGRKHPHLVRDPSRPDLLGEILKPLRAAPGPPEKPR
jgi:predicted metalloprotease with PDZ domain